jgi:acetyltransferase
MGDIRKIFNPEGVALIGATEEERTVGRTLLENLLRARNRRIFPVNPKWKTVLGLESYPTILQVPERMDLAIIATPPATVPALVEECGKAEAEGVIIVSSGFKEMGKEGKSLEKQILDIRKRYGMRIIGPESLGIIRPNSDFNASILAVTPTRGNIAFVSQGGALGAAILDWAIDAHIGFGTFSSLGSMIDVDFGDLIDFLGNDLHTRSIMLYMENIVHSKKFMSAARGFAHSKPIVVVKPGRLKESSRPPLSHTGALVTCDRVYDAAFKRAGVVRIKEIADLFNTVRVLHSKHLPKGPRLAIITNVGWVGVMAMDSLRDLGGELAALSGETLEQLRSFLPPHWKEGNPIDLLWDADVERYVKTLDVCLESPGVDGILVIYTPQNVAEPEALAEAVVQFARKTWKPVITAWMGGKAVQRGRDIFFENTIPTYETPEDAVKTYLYMVQYQRNLESLYETPAELPIDQAPPKNNLKALIRRAVKEGRAILNEEESKRFLINYGIPTITARITQNVEGAVSIAKFVGYPVVLKIVSPDITHKSDVGGVVIGVNSDERLGIEYDRLIKRVMENNPQVKIQGVTVQKMVDKIDYEIILGAKKDSDFGSVILFGMGGIGVQMLRDFAVSLSPLNQSLARKLMQETDVYRMLQGYRGKMPADLRQIEQIIVSFSNLIIDFPEIAELDINPLAVSEGKAYALDARIIIDKNYVEEDNPSQYPHLVITPYPTRYVTSWRLPDGTEVHLRPIKPEDEPSGYELLTNLSPQTFKERFFQPAAKITHEMLIRLCNLDYDREVALVAEVREGSKRRFLGIGTLVIDPDSGDAEFSVVVHDDYQGKGLGYKLIDALIGIAQDKGLEKFFGLVLASNKKMISLCKKLGFTVDYMPEGLSKVVLHLK